MEDLSWDPICPLANQEVIWQFQDEEDRRSYPNFIPRSKYRKARLGALNVGDVAKAAIEWLKHQGVGEFDHNSGRKALARWCKQLNVGYPQSVHIHGDLPDVWNKHYEFNVRPMVTHPVREQSRDPEVATAALRIFAQYIGRGTWPYTPQLNDIVARQNNFMITSKHGADVAKDLLMGFKKEEDTEDEEEEQKMQPTPKPKPVQKRKRVTQIKYEPGELTMPPRPKKAKKRVKKEQEVEMKDAISARIRLRPLGRGSKFKMIRVMVS